MDYLQQILSEIHFVVPTTGSIISGVLACVLLLFSALASGSEIAFFSLSPNNLNELDEDKSDTDRKILKLREDSERTLATILIANNLINVTIIMLLNYFIAHVVDFGNAVWLEFIVITVILTFLLLLFGEIMPKVYAGQHTLAFCRYTADGILFLSKVFHPLSEILIKTGLLAEKVVQKENHVLSVDDLEQALELTDKEELKEEKNMLEGIVRFGDETAKEVMTSRQDVVDLDFRLPFPEVLKCIIENNYSRIPVYQDTIDNIRGILYIKDLLPHLSKPATFRWQSLIRPPYFVPETKKIDDLLRDFQDEFGGTSGIITLEDILEEIVGEINDEYDEEEKNYTRINANTYIFEGKTLLSDLYKILNLDDETFEEVEGDADSLAGLLLEIKGDFPELHERIDYKNFTFEVTEIDEHRISKIKVVIHEKPAQE